MTLRQDQRCVQDELLPPTERPGLHPPRRPCPVSPSFPQILNLTSVYSIGNLRTAALISIDGSIESYCVPNFDSPSVFARILDKDKGGHFSITPTIPFTVKQNYLPSSNVSLCCLRRGSSQLPGMNP
jgi:hypothetical protein